MKKSMGFLVALLFIFALLSVSVPGHAANYYSPNKNHKGNIGDSTHIWQYGYFDNLIGDGTNAYMYGFKYSVSATSASATLTAGQSGKAFVTTGSNTQLTLPSAASGLWYQFAVTSGSLYVKPASGQRIYGLCSTVTSAVVTTTSVGQSLRLFSNGTGWYVDGYYGTWSCAAGL